MGKLEKFGRSLLKKLGARRHHRNTNATSSTSSTSSSTSSDEESTSPYLHTFHVAPPEDVTTSSDGYITDDTSLSPLEIDSSQGYHSTSELSPRSAPSDDVTSSEGVTKRLYVKKDYPRVNVKLEKKKASEFQSQTSLTVKPTTKLSTRSATLSNLSIDPEDPIDRFLKTNVYKTKMISTVFEAKDGGFEEIYDDVTREIDRWFENKNMMAVACEMHWSVPRGKRSRQLECRLKEKLLNALRENNKRLLYLRGMGSGKLPIKLAESKTVENISRVPENDSVRGIYQRSYTHLLPYLHRETPEWHSQYWTLQDLEKTSSEDVTSSEESLIGQFSPEFLAGNSLISLNIIGLSILGNDRKSSCNSLFL